MAEMKWVGFRWKMRERQGGYFMSLPILNICFLLLVLSLYLIKNISHCTPKSQFALKSWPSETHICAGLVVGQVWIIQWRMCSALWYQCIYNCSAQQCSKGGIGNIFYFPYGTLNIHFCLHNMFVSEDTTEIMIVKEEHNIF